MSGPLKGIGDAVAVLDAAKPELAKLKKASEDFEAAFVKSLFTEMRKGTQDSAFGGETMGAGMYRDMMDQALAESASKSGTIGIAKMMYKQMVPRVIAEQQAKMRLTETPKEVDAKA